MQIRIWLVVVLAGAVSPGCDLEDCTEAGCSSSITLQVTHADGQSFVGFGGTLDTEAGEVIAFDCDGTHTGTVASDVLIQCAPDSVTLEISPATASAQITTARGQVQVSLEPEYRTLTPNGEECGPTCFVATEKVTIPLP